MIESHWLSRGRDALTRFGVGAMLLILIGGAPAQPIVYELDEDRGWVRTQEPAPGTDEAFIAEVRRLIADDQPQRARSMLKKWLARNEGTRNPWLPEARLLLGDAKTAAGREYRALFDYEEVITRYPDSQAYAKAVSRELDIAVRYANGLNRRILFGLVRWGATSGLAEELLIRAQERMPGSAIGERAMIELADYYYRRREMSMASQAYDLFLQNYPESEYRRKALMRQVLSNIAQFKGPRHDGSGLEEARLLIQEFQDRYPLEAERTGLNEALLARLDESLGAKMLAAARWYRVRGDEVAARFALRRLLREHPRTVAASRGREMLGEMGLEVLPGAVAQPPARRGGIPPIAARAGREEAS